jgi:hypothetical protein
LEERITAFEKHIDNNPDLDYDSLTPDQFEDPDFDAEDFTIGGLRRIHLAHLKLPEWLKAVRNDRTQLQFLLEKTQSVTAKRDGKLAELKAFVEAKVCQPTINLVNRPLFDRRNGLRGQVIRAEMLACASVHPIAQAALCPDQLLHST